MKCGLEAIRDTFPKWKKNNKNTYGNLQYLDMSESNLNKRGSEMAYKYREVQCPWCDHVFMWNKNGREGLILYLYKLKETG